MVFYVLVHLVIEHFKATVRHENLRHADAFWCLVVLKNRSHDARQCKSRAVERVAKFYLLVVRTTEAAVQTISLVALEITC